MYLAKLISSNLKSSVVSKRLMYMFDILYKEFCIIIFINSKLCEHLMNSFIELHF